MLGGCSSINAQMYNLLQRSLKAGIIVVRGLITTDGLNSQTIRHGRTTHFYRSSKSLKDLRTQRSIMIMPLNRHRKSIMVGMVNGKFRINLTFIKFHHISFERQNRWD